jgi:hypothetical protein
MFLLPRSITKLETVLEDCHIIELEDCHIIELIIIQVQNIINKIVILISELKRENFFHIIIFTDFPELKDNLQIEDLCLPGYNAV